MAGELAGQGKLQSEIARELGVSVMTYHRWRRASAEDPAVAESARAVDPAVNDKPPRGTQDLMVENSRLRRLVADLMLEKIELEEMLQRRNAPAKLSRG